MLIAVSMVKDEADIIGFTLEHLRSEGVDHVLIADNLSTDETRDIISGFGAWVTLTDDPEFGYYQSRKMSALCAQAHQMGATWVLPFDADEAIRGPVPLGDFFRDQPQDVGVVTITGWDYLPRRALDDPNPYRRFQCRRPNPQPLPKVAFRACERPLVHMGNHDVDNVPGRRVDGLHLRHVQYRSLEQMTRKLRNGARVYAATDLHPGHGTHWRTERSDDDLAAMWEALLAEDGIDDPWT